jgi:predicted Rossmann fold nucleotide-binding protein DprA/Smf involved in DNA uptake
VATSPVALTAILLTERSLPSDAPPLTASEFWPLARSVDLGDLADGVLATSGWAAGSRPVDQERIDALLARSTSMAFELDRLQQSGITVVTAFDDSYPDHLRDRLGDAAPPLLYAAGDLSLLAHESLAIVGSRGVSEAGADVARRAARAAVGDGLSVVSGGARGVDQLAMSAAWEAGGTVVGVLSEGLERTLRSRDNRAAVLDGRAVLCTPFKPTAGFSTGNAMGRNKIVYALSSIALVVSCDEGSGGTWAGATEALTKRLSRIAVWMDDGGGPGNVALVRHGAAPVDDFAELMAMRRGRPVAQGGRDQPAVTGTQLGFDLHL